MVFHPQLNYEIASYNGDLEYGDCGPIVAVDNRAVKHLPFRKAAATTVPQVLEGFAVRYDAVHRHKGRQEIFQKGCFAGSLHSVMFKIDHVLTEKSLGDQDDNTLELADSDVGLGFRLKLAPGHLERIGGRDEMSCMYQEIDVGYRTIGHEEVRVIKSAVLVEISAVFVGAIRNTYAIVRNASDVGKLCEDVKSGFPSEAAATIFKRALQNLDATHN
jgi:phage head maturation protease